MQHPRRPQLTLLLHIKCSFKPQSASLSLIISIEPQWWNLAADHFLLLCRFSDFLPQDEPLLRNDPNLSTSLQRAVCEYRMPPASFKLNWTQWLIRTFQEWSDIYICKIICHLHPAIQKIYWWKLSVLCRSKTVENHLSWLANRDKITNENGWPKTLSNITLWAERTSIFM